MFGASILVICKYNRIHLGNCTGDNVTINKLRLMSEGLEIYFVQPLISNKLYIYNILFYFSGFIAP